MCIGEPMKVLDVDGGRARCAGARGEEIVDIALVPEVRPGDHLLVFLGVARRLLTASEAEEIRDALAALAAVARGESIDGHFADLTSREPSLPPHMQQAHLEGITSV